ncbi:DUF6279 family lipoprotein [Pseudomonas sp. RIT-PI-S]|uniref:DUF6279 family lipoprotein n=1 Tax=Pseudomonas sp. RIT-PI-S TaxID=3035295 RepID=UPI0021D968E4|nr:DUF6279 family lipoprotein [Pseudomonas sp. RIT-PI-S]
MAFSAVRRWWLVACLGGLLAMAGCTRMDLAYRNLDVLIPWTLDDYLDMNREQKAWFEERLADHLRWHCQTQLPGYLPWLDRLRNLAMAQQVSDEELQALTREGEQAAEEVARQITPSAVELLQGLNEDQVRSLREALAQDIAKRRKELVTPALAEQVQTRANNMHKRLLPWLGELHADQDAAILRWSQQLGDHNSVALANREQWQQALLAALAQRSQPAFEGQIAQLLQHRQTLWSDAYRADRTRAQAAARRLTAELLQLSDAGQRQRFVEQLDTLRGRFATLRCLKKQ